ncbi:hydrogenase maturation protease [Chitinophaga sancti]|uniref:Hydrogenase maturation protease n=1 Tax=Chitinophaga sancti TaxID=1004 RepID=A0A1K1S5Z9_9BACT|nr:hydrogenase maturation protease [Chitinophaga sancti]WQD62239.1 hydrogenase maturation protease [Chitinophaga sancti]WQG92192.1 hydrogenase maturation protease [Chitinophaga sancti]SFW79777.1 hydrogenase maturation protease [Chitinophaga sancti]
MRKNKTLLLGVGNYLMGDEGIGVHVAQRLEVSQEIPGIDVVDGGTGGFHLLEFFEQYQKVILVDATLDGLKPGTIRCIKPKYASDFPPEISAHDIGLKDLMSALQLLDKMPDLYLFVVSIESIQQQGMELTKDIEGCIPKLLEEIKSAV